MLANCFASACHPKYMPLKRASTRQEAGDWPPIPQRCVPGDYHEDHTNEPAFEAGQS